MVYNIPTPLGNIGASHVQTLDHPSFKFFAPLSPKESGKIASYPCSKLTLIHRLAPLGALVDKTDVGEEIEGGIEVSAAQMGVGLIVGDREFLADKLGGFGRFIEEVLFHGIIDTLPLILFIFG